ncbi:uncharacterized protein FTOL_11418 [Fusarium torulosum]|uniref:Uncharacterized protein n=1 Tax=Fusarium torulosum TaxID=33205 RepID=A0AAE8MK05_9HYPO|nr:uncharacterized protein FTOL_11418 [Fusarium torulosum]
MEEILRVQLAKILSWFTNKLESEPAVQELFA